MSFSTFVVQLLLMVILLQLRNNGCCYGLDTADLFVSTGPGLPQDITKVELYGVSSECYNCLKLQLLESVTSSASYLSVDTRWPMNLEFRVSPSGNQQESKVIDFNYHFGENGSYSVLLVGNEQPYVNQTQFDWALFVNIQPSNSNIPILVAFVIYFGIAILWVVSVKIYNRYQARKHLNIAEDQPEDRPNVLLEKQKKEEQKPQSTKLSSGRVQSLDAFRGLSIVVMIFVNYGGGGYWFFSHSLWNGLTVADLVFPWFIFIMGVAMPMSFAALQRRGVSSFDIFKKVLRRSVILYGLGLFLNNGFDLEQWRIAGVLQRFGVSYFVIALILLWVPKLERKTKEDPPLSVNREEDGLLKHERVEKRTWHQDLSPYLLQWILVLSLIAVWVLVTFLLDVPGCGRGYLGPGGIGDGGNFVSCTGGASGYVDKLIFGVQHIYQHPTCAKLYLTGPYDPEGTLGCITSCVLCYMGVQAGRIILFWKTPTDRIKRWFVWGIFWGVIGTILCLGRQNGGFIPINKNLWSLSFILTMAGSANLMLLVCYLLVDVSHLWSGAPFNYVGMNPILIYMGHELLGDRFPFSWQVAVKTHANLLSMNLVGLSVWVLIAYYMYLQDFFINI